MKKLWFLILLGTILACGTTNAELQEQTIFQSILTETESQAKIMCKIVVKRYGVSDQVHEPVKETEVTIVDNKGDLPTPADYNVLGSMTIEADKECKIIEIIDAIKTGASTFGANYVLPWKVQSIHITKEEWGTEIDKHKLVQEKTVSTYILLRRENLSI
jgi:hypothetical protein